MLLVAQAVALELDVEAAGEEGGEAVEGPPGAPGAGRAVRRARRTTSARASGPSSPPVRQWSPAAWAATSFPGGAGFALRPAAGRPR